MSFSHDTTAGRRYSWLGAGDALRERLIEPLDAAGPEPTLRCAGELDAACAEELAAALLELSEREIDRLVLDLREVELLDGCVLGVIAATQLRLERRGVALLAHVQGQPRKMFELSGLAGCVMDGPAARLGLAA
jgi:anti-anti-sigma factor